MHSRAGAVFSGTGAAAPLQAVECGLRPREIPRAPRRQKTECLSKCNRMLKQQMRGFSDVALSRSRKRAVRRCSCRSRCRRCWWPWAPSPPTRRWPQFEPRSDAPCRTVSHAGNAPEHRGTFTEIAEIAEIAETTSLRVALAFAASGNAEGWCRRGTWTLSGAQPSRAAQTSPLPRQRPSRH